MIIVHETCFLFVLKHHLNKLFNQGFRIGIEYDLVVGAMSRLDDMPQYLVCLPRSLQNADWAVIFEGDGEFIKRPNTAAADNDGVR